MQVVCIYKPCKEGGVAVSLTPEHEGLVQYRLNGVGAPRPVRAVAWEKPACAMGSREEQLAAAIYPRHTDMGLFQILQGYPELTRHEALVHAKAPLHPELKQVRIEPGVWGEGRQLGGGTSEAG